MTREQYEEALTTAARAVRSELIRLDYVEGDDEPDKEDEAIATATIFSFMLFLMKSTPGLDMGG